MMRNWWHRAVQQFLRTAQRQGTARPSRRVRPRTEPLEDRTLPSVTLAADINTTTTTGSTPVGLVNVNGTAFFFANDGSHGNELWKSDGTAAGTGLVLDINPGSDGSNNGYTPQLANVNGVVYFSANDGVHGSELWRSDGTAAGTRLVKDINPGPATSDSLISGLTNVNGTLFFSAYDPVNGQELWKSDGTTAGTKLVKDINPGGAFASPTRLTAVGGTLYFSANDGSHGFELWKSDGTPTGTVLVKDINPGPGGGSPGSLTAVGNTLYFTANDGSTGLELWKSDAGGTALVKDLRPGPLGSSPSDLTAAGGKLYFTADGGSGEALWKCDAAGVARMPPSGTGPNLPSPADLTAVGNTLFFTTYDTTNGQQLWKNDATGLSLVKVVTPASSSLYASNLTAAGAALYFTRTNPAGGGELWKSDGTSGGTVLVKGFNPGPKGLPPAGLTAVNGTLFFRADDGSHGVELWKSDGTAGGTVLVKDIQAFTDSSPASLVAVNGTLFFTANDGAHGVELWKTTGGPGAAVMVKDIVAGPGGSAPANLTAVGNLLFFTAFAPNAGVELWKSDGTASGTVLVKDIRSGAAGSYPANLTALGSTLFFTAGDAANGNELWKSDGTPTGTVLVKDIYPGPADAIAPSGVGAASSLTVMGNAVYFAADDGTRGVELWKSDGTSNGTLLVKDINTTTGSGSDPLELTVMGNRLYFSATNGTSGSELWKSDGTSTGTTLVKDIVTGPGGSYPSDLKANGGTLFFAATDAAHGTELWKTDGTGANTVLVKDIVSGIGSAAPFNMIGVGNLIFFNANDGVTGTELWKSDGTPTGTVLVKDVNPGAADSLPSDFANLGGTLFFTANDGGDGRELWRSDGTGAGTLLVKDLFAGLPGSEPSDLTVFNGRVFFAANDGVAGSEVWSAGNSPGALQFSGATATVFENGGTVALTVTRTGGSDGPVSVSYAAGGGTAVAGVNYLPASGVLTFLDGETSKTITINVLDDGQVTANRTLNLTLTAPTGGATLGTTSTAVLTIVNTDGNGGVLQFNPSTVSVNENAGSVALTVTRTGGTQGAVSVRYAVTGGTAVGGVNYSLAAGTLNFAAGEAIKTIPVTILDDGLFTANRTLNVTLSGATGGASLGTASTAVLTIVNTDAPPAGTLQFSAAGYSVAENGGGVQITVTRSGGTNGTVSVQYSVSDGTAIADVNYTAVSGTLTFAGGETTKTFTIPVLDDGLPIGDVTASLTLTGPTGGAVLGGLSASTLTIVDTDTFPTPDDPIPGPALTGDVTPLVNITVSQQVYQRRQRRNRLVLTFTNTGTSPLEGPLVLVLNGLDRRIRVKGSAGSTRGKGRQASPFFTLSTDPINPGDTVDLSLVFLNAPRRIRFTAQLFAGPGMVQPLAVAKPAQPSSPLLRWGL
jgi:ELWxxDGT repeat protein